MPDRFGTTPSYTVGVEEEFQLVAPSTLQLAPAVEEVSGAIPDGSKRLARELFQDCVEMRSFVFSTVAELARELPALRRMVAEAANKAGVGIGLPRSRHKVCPRGPHGGLSSRSHIEGGTRDDGKTGVTKPPLRSVRFNEIPDPGPRKYLLEGLIPVGYATLLHGDGGTAKAAKLFLMRPNV